MQRQVVGVPRAWVWLFERLARAVVTTVYLYFGGSEAPFLYYDTMYYHILDV